MSNLPYSRTIGAGKTFLSPTDYQIYISTIDGVATVVLPKIETIFNSFINTFGNPNSIFGFRFKDIGGNASVNKIIFEGMDDNKVNGVQKFEVTTNGASGVVLISGINNYVLVSDVPAGATFKTSFLFNVKASDLNSFPVAASHTQIYDNSIPANAVPFGGYYKIKTPVVSTSGAAFTMSVLRGIPPPTNVLLFNEPLNYYQIGVVSTYYVNILFQQTEKSSAKPSYGLFDFFDSMGGSIDNPQDWESGDIDVYLQYFDFQV